MKIKPWLVYAIITTTCWGVWGALIEMPEKAGFPATLGFSVWALTMMPPGLIVLWKARWKLEHDLRSIFMGSIVGLLGAGGQLLLFQALRSGPAYLVFPFISLSPVVTIIISCVLLKERASTRGWIGIVLALLAIPLLSYQDPGNAAGRGYFWIVLSVLVFLAWGIQAYVIKLANRTMKAESIFFYMMLMGLVLMPFAIGMTDFKQDINWGFTGPWVTAMIQFLNALGALCLVFAFRHGKAIIVSPLTNAVAPVITVVISLGIYMVIPHPIIITGMVVALIATFLMAIEDEENEEGAETGT